MITEGQQFGSASYLYDAAGDRTRITWGDEFYVGYAYDMIGGVISINEEGATSGVGVLATYGYDNLGRRTSVAYGNGTSRSYAYDPVGRLAGLQMTFPNSSGYNELIGSVGGSGTPISYTPSSQIASITRSNDAYAWTGGYNVNRAYATNGLNQFTSSGSTTLGYDGDGNLNLSGTTTYTYDALNRLAILATGEEIGHDPANRISQFYWSPSNVTEFYYAGPELIAEYTSGPITSRYVPGPGTDEPIVWYQGSGTASRNFLQADERGSIIAVSNSAGTVTNVNSYDEFGIPASGNVGRYQYTGQLWSSDVGMYWYKARWYSPTLGRFMQTDPIGYGDGLNMYNYAHSDPINGSDPTGTSTLDSGEDSAILNGGNASDGPDTGANYSTPPTLQSYDPANCTLGTTDCAATSIAGDTITITGHATAGDTITMSPGPVAGPGGGFEGGPLGNSGDNFFIRPNVPQSNQNNKPAYCNGWGYAIGNFIDEAGGATKTVGTTTVVAGGAIGLATAITGVGAGAGGAVAGAGGSIYLTGAAISLVGNSVKWLASGGSNYDSANVLSGAFEVPIAGALGPVSRTVVGNVADRLMGDGMGQKNPCGG